MLFREAIVNVVGLRFLSENLDLRSPMGKRYLLDSKMMCCDKEIVTELNLVNQVSQVLDFVPDLISKIQNKLMQLRDIRGSVNNLRSNLVLDDVELFEIKMFALVAQEIAELQNERSKIVLEVPDLSQLIQLLDPQNTRIPSFHIYSIYSEELAKVRQELKMAKTENENWNSKIEELFNKAQEIETKVREDLCVRMSAYGNDLVKSLNQLAHLDLLIAKALQSKTWNFCRPEISREKTIYKEMFNPLVKHELLKQNKEYQAVDIQIEKSVCLITGANMAGKTVLLKTLALCQYLFQFGFYVPARTAKIAIVDQILVSMNDEQSELSGLSSFASEMMTVSGMVDVAKKQNNVLILVDELARTTNPVEGLAIVNAVADIFYRNEVRSVITTHYSGLQACFRKLRVKGLDKDFEEQIITQKNINSYMDYSLVEDQNGEVPHEALRIASLLGINKEIIERAQNQLSVKASNNGIKI